MGGPAQAIANIAEQGLKDTLKEGAEGWFASSGKAFLEHMGQEGKYLSDTLGSYEALRDSTKSKSKLILDSISKKPAAQQTGDLYNFRQAMIMQSGRSGTILKSNSGLSNDIQVLHPDLAKTNTVLRKQAIREIMQKSGKTSVEAAADLDKMLSLQHTRNAAQHMLTPLHDITTGRLDPIEAHKKFGDAVAERVAQNIKFGLGDSNIKSVIEAIAQTKGRVSASNVADFMDVYIRQTFPASYRISVIPQKAAYKSYNDAEKIISNLASYILTSRIAIPHATQWVDTILNSDIKSSIQGFLELVTDWKTARNSVLRSGALEEELYRNLESTIRGGDSLIKKVVHQPGFHWVRAREIEFAAITGKHQAINASEELLRNSQNKGAIGTLTSLGINPQDVLSNNGLTQDMREKAMYYAANRDMFSRSPLNTPFRWQSNPVARLMSMYKPFQFNMTRMIYNSLKESYKARDFLGLARKLAVLGTLFPAAGELVVLAENTILGRKPGETDTPFTESWKTNHETADQYINAMAHVGGFGVMYSLFRSTKQRMMANFVIGGPMISSTFDMMYDLGRGTVGREEKITGETVHDFRPFERDLLRKLPIGGSFAARKLVPPEEKESHGVRRPSLKKH